MVDFLYFLFDAEGQNNIDPASISIQEQPYNIGSLLVDPALLQPLSMKLDFRLNNAALPLHIYPLFPGNITFMADQNATGIFPEPGTHNFGEENYDNWKVKGKIRISLEDHRLNMECDQYLKQINFREGQLPLVPNVIWVGPVELPKEFIFQTLASGIGLQQGTVYNPKRKPTDDGWREAAISKFLSGEHKPKFKFNRSSGDNYNFSLPAASVSPTGQVSLAIEIAYMQEMTDDSITIDCLNPTRPTSSKCTNFDFFDSNYSGLSLVDPSSDANGNLPARMIFQSLKEILVNNSGILFDRITQPSAPYLMLRFTRSWQLGKTCSINLPLQMLIVEDMNAVEKLRTKLPAHGVFYCNNLEYDTDYLLKLEGNFTWLTYDPECWKKSGTKNPIAISTELQDWYLRSNVQHIVMRNKMSIEMLLDTTEQIPKDPHNTCTYLSMRRFTRAFTCNRISGGRLITDLKRRKQKKHYLHKSFFHLSKESRNLIFAATGFNVRTSFAPLMDTATKGGRDIKILFGVLFGTVSGDIAYNIWQSQYVEMNSDENMAHYDEQFIGFGGPGALKYLGLADYNSNFLMKSLSETDVQYSNRLIQMIFQDLEQGTVLQFWHKAGMFQLVRDRTIKTEEQFLADPRKSWGHSPVFVSYFDGDCVDKLEGHCGFYIYDQHSHNGPNFCQYNFDMQHSMRLLQWNLGSKLYPQELWFGIKWKE